MPDAPPPEPPLPSAPRLARFSASDRLLGRAGRVLRAHRYLVGAVLVHVVVLLAMSQSPGFAEREHARAQAAEARAVQRAVADTGVRELQRRVQRMAQIQRRLAADAAAEGGTRPTAVDESPGLVTSGASPEALAATAARLAADIDAAERRLRAAALARLTGQPLAQALRTVDAEAAAARAKDAPAPPGERAAETIARLERHARAALEARRLQLDARRQGVPVALAASGPGRVPQWYPADGIPRSAVEQMASVLRMGPADGRVGVPGVEGARSINREGVKGEAGGRIARPDDPAPDPGARFADGPEVRVAGGRIDLTRRDGGAQGRAESGLPVAPPEAAVTYATAGGRAFGAGGRYADRVYLDSWYVIGPFAADREAPLATVHPPQEDVDLDGVYPGLGGRLLTWHYVSRGFYPFIPPDRADAAIYYAYTEVRVDHAQQAWLSIASDDDSMLWLDGRLVWVSEPGDKPWYHPPYYQRDELRASLALSDGQRRVHLEPGRHALLFKLYNADDRAFFSVVVSSR